jgi:hypothetical protein
VTGEAKRRYLLESSSAGVLSAATEESGRLHVIVPHLDTRHRSGRVGVRIVTVIIAATAATAERHQKKTRSTNY